MIETRFYCRQQGLFDGLHWRYRPPSERLGANTLGVQVRVAVVFALLIAAMISASPVVAGDDAVTCVQRELVARGADVGAADGSIGPKTEAASIPVAAEFGLQPLSTETADIWCAALTFPGALPNSEGGWSGYRPVALLPPAIRKTALASVYEVETLTFQVDTTTNPEDFVRTLRIVDPATEPTSTSPLVNLAIETCRRQGLTRCPIPDIDYRGTAFAAGSGIYTCRHLFHNWLVLAAHLNGRRLDELQPPFRLSRWDGTVIYDSAQDASRIELINDDDRLLMILPQKHVAGQLSGLMSQSELMKLTFDGWSAKVVPAPVLTPAPSGKVSFAVGYPGETSAFGDDRDAPGSTLVGASGIITGILPKKGLLEGRMISTGGLSGSPLVLRSGEVVGVRCFAGSDSASNEDTRMGPFLDDDEARHLWGILKTIPFRD